MACSKLCNHNSSDFIFVTISFVRSFTNIAVFGSRAADVRLRAAALVAS